MVDLGCEPWRWFVHVVSAGGHQPDLQGDLRGRAQHHRQRNRPLLQV